MRTHWRVHTGERPYVCAECDQSFARSIYLKRHALIHTDEKPYQCDVCGQSFKQSSTLRKHKRTHTGERPHICVECGESFKQKWELKNHELLHKKSYKCDECGKLFWQSIALAGHKQIHTREGPNICPRMNVDNTSPENANTIIKQELENDEMGTNSPLQFQMPTTSSAALNLNNEEKEDECDEQQNQDQDGLEKFVVEVEGLEKIEWDDEEESGSPSVVEMDLKDGEGEGQISLKDKIMRLLQSGKEGDTDGQIEYAPTKIGNILKCNWPGCEYQMKTIGDMLIHWREHTEPRPPSYVCVECGKSFKRSNNLKKHELNHKKPYQCDVCGQSFKHSYSLNEHKRNHTGEKPYSCMVGCGESFKTSNELWKHRQEPCTTLGNYSNIWHSGDGKME